MSNTQATALTVAICLTIAVMFLTQAIWITHWLDSLVRRVDSIQVDVAEAPTEELRRP